MCWAQVGASNLGHIILYTVLNQTPGLLCDRAYFPGRRSICDPSVLHLLMLCDRAYFPGRQSPWCTLQHVRPSG
jgi:hypothetical protein